MEKIFVAIRVRPPKADETNTTGTHWKFEDNRISLHRRLGTPISGLSYAFDHVFDERCTNERIYETLTKGIVHAAVQGFNGTAFAYGQTSSGKTFTMNGSESDPGIIHRAVRDIFEMIQATTDREYLIRVSYMEIYNEDIHDLFTVENQKLQIHESLERGIYVAGLKEEIVNNSEQVLQLLQSGEVNRHFGETNMNVRSSRSHTIFRMVIESRGKDTHHSIEYSSADAIRVSVLNLVDLAGSERIAKTGAGGVRLREGKYINKSLMVLGNVINKLSDGVKQRGHIPYRDSKLTRILQPALGGNAKTSIVCTIAPEEIHVEETKGTLQFASRAKRITNCAQVNEILTDAALLKRQKLEIEELRNKLQGSRSEVLEQEILKLRNDMLKYELEREKLAMELEEERRSQKERERHIREQQMELNNLNTLFSNSDGDGISTQSNDSAKQNLKEEFSDGHHISQEEAFKTPCFKALPNTFVARRSNYSKLPECSPLPESISNVADEDTWLKMNKGFKANLDLLVTPARNVQSFPSSDSTLAFSNDNHKEEIHLLRKQLEIAAEEKNEQKKIQVEQEQLNKQLMQEISQLRQEAMLVRKIPGRLFESLTNCKDMYEDTMSVMQDVVADKKPTAAKIISCTTDIGISLFSTLESHFKMAMDENSSLTDNYSLMQEQCEVLLRERLNRTISSLVISEEPKVDDELVSNLSTSTKKGCSLGGDEAAWWKEKLSSEFEVIKDKYQNLEKQFQENNHLLEVSKERYQNLEKDFRSLKAERDSLQQTVSKSTQKLTLLANEKENAMKDLSSEVNRQKDLAEGMKHFSVAFASRQRSLLSFHSEFKSKVESLRTQNRVPVLKPVG